MPDWTRGVVKVYVVTTGVCYSGSYSTDFTLGLKGLSSFVLHSKVFVTTGVYYNVMTHHFLI